MDSQLDLASITDLINSDLTKDCTLPQVLKPESIQRIITQKASRWFYRYYMFSTQKAYYYVDLQSMYSNKSTNTKFFYLPDEIQGIKWIYVVNYSDMQSIGYLLPSNSVNFGATSTPFVASINISEWAESMTVMNALADSLATYSKNTIKHSFNANSKRFEVMTSCSGNLILEVNAEIPAEYLYGDPLFLQYATGLSYQEMGMILQFAPVTLAGGVILNGQMFYDYGTELVNKVEAAVLKVSNTSFFINKTR